MAEVINKNPEWIMKLSSSSMNMSAAVAKLISYNHAILEEKRKDKEFYLEMKNAFQENAQFDHQQAERYTSISFEADSIVKGDGISK